MLLKLLLPYYDRSVDGGVIRAWHKKEGDWVNYGDDLFDLEVEEVRHMRQMPAGKRQVELMTSPRALDRLLRVKELMMEPIQPHEDAYQKITAHGLIRITSSDAGLLRSIRVRAGERRRVGDLLAVLATDEQDSLPGLDDPLAEVCAFRSIASFVTPD
jgi:multidrug efflux pump subunit AcrA (membrane-fusion protein)